MEASFITLCFYKVPRILKKEYNKHFAKFKRRIKIHKWNKEIFKVLK